MLNLSELITRFFDEYLIDPEIELYNEFSLQHELGFFLRTILPKDYKVQFERNIKSLVASPPPVPRYIKKEIDLCIFSRDMSEKYAIELKFIAYGQTPEMMYGCVKDLRFMEEVRQSGFAGAVSLCVTTEPTFYQPSQKKGGIYKFFRGGRPLSGRIFKPTGHRENRESILLQGNYQITWHEFSQAYSPTCPPNRKPIVAYCIVEAKG